MEYVIIWSNLQKSFSQKCRTLLEAKTFFEDLKRFEWKVLKELDGKVINFREGVSI